LYLDVRDLISVDDAMDDADLRFGPNGGLVFCMEYLAQNFEWLEEALEEDEDDYILFDCPGQIELYTHIPVMRQLVDRLQQLNFRICGVFIVDAQFLLDAAKFVSGVLSTLSAMVSLEIPHVSVLSKVDLLNTRARKNLERFLEPDMHALLAEELDGTGFGERFKKLNHAIANVVDDFSLVKFLPLDPTDEESIGDLLTQIDIAIQYGEDLEPKEPRDMGGNEREDEDNDD